MLKLLHIASTLSIIGSNVFGTFDSCPTSTPNNSDPHHGTAEKAWNTQAYLEQMLREQGALKPGQHLALHEVWELVEFIKGRATERKQLQQAH